MTEERKSELNRIGSADNDPYINTEFDHKAFLTTPRTRTVKEPRDVLTKDLRLSFIDAEMAFIASNKLSAAEEWRSLGMEDLAERRLVHLVGLLSLNASIKGTERLLQSEPNINIRSNMTEQMQLGIQQFEEEDNKKKAKRFFG